MVMASGPAGRGWVSSPDIVSAAPTKTYALLHEHCLFSFEWAANLLLSICYNDELYLAACDDCDSAYVEDAYALSSGQCPCCEMMGLSH